MVISNCAITKQDSVLLDLDSMDASHAVGASYHTGIDLTGSKIYTIYDGTVVIANDGHIGHSVIVQTGMSFCVVYSNLSSMSVRAGQYVSKGDLLGVVNRYVHVELLKLVKSAWPVRIGETTWYKSDPSELITTRLMSQNVQRFDNLGITEISNYPSGKPVEVEGYSKFILSNNKGED